MHAVLSSRIGTERIASSTSGIGTGPTEDDLPHFRKHPVLESIPPTFGKLAVGTKYPNHMKIKGQGRYEQ